MTATKKVLALVLTGLLLTGCALTPPYRVHPNFQDKLKMFKTVAVLPPDVDVFYVEVGGIPEKMEEWSKQARKNILTAVQAELAGRAGFIVKPFAEDSLPEGAKSVLEENHAFFEAVKISIVMHTYPPPAGVFPFEEKVKNFDYSLGEEIRELKMGEADALLLVDGMDHIWSEGRKALQALGVIIGIGAGVRTGVVIIPRLGGGTGVNAALIDVNGGSILWYNGVGSGAGYDLRDPESSASLVKELFKDFPPSQEK